MHMLTSIILAPIDTPFKQILRNARPPTRQTGHNRYRPVRAIVLKGYRQDRDNGNRDEDSRQDPISAQNH
jgi:hypothetical protein